MLSMGRHTIGDDSFPSLWPRHGEPWLSAVPGETHSISSHCPTDLRMELNNKASVDPLKRYMLAMQYGVGWRTRLVVLKENLIDCRTTISGSIENNTNRSSSNQNTLSAWEKCKYINGKTEQNNEDSQPW